MKQSKDTQPALPKAPNDEESRQIYKVAGLAFLLNLCLAVMKTLLAVYSGSLSVTASAIDSGTDAVASLVIYGGVKLSTKKTKAFPMGLYKLENVASVVIALFIFIAGYEIICKILSPAARVPHIHVSTILLLFAGTAATFIFGQYAIRVGRKTESPALIAEGRHCQVDVLSSLVVLGSVSLSYLDLDVTVCGATIDQIGAALILVFIIRTAWDLLSGGMRVLLDASIDFDTLGSIGKIIQNEPMVYEIKSLMGRSAGRFRFIQAIITLKTKNIEKAHQIRKDIEVKIRTQVPHVEKVSIQFEPRNPTHVTIALPLDLARRHINAHFGEAPYFCIVHIHRKGNRIEKQVIVDNPHRSVDIAKGIRVAEWLVSQRIDHVGMKQDLSSKGPGYVLSNGGVTIHLIEADLLDQAIDEISAAGWDR